MADPKPSAKSFLPKSNGFWSRSTMMMFGRKLNALLGDGNVSVEERGSGYILTLPITTTSKPLMGLMFEDRSEVYVSIGLAGVEERAKA